MPIDSPVQGTSLADALSTWAALQGIGKKSSTRDYHQEIVGLILRHWPGSPADVVEDLTLTRVSEFVLKVAHFSGSRFNGIVSVLRATIPAAKKIKRRPIVCKERVILTPDQFALLVAELESRPRSHGGLVIRFLVNTGFRINEARQLKWGDVHADRIIAPGAITKNGRPRSVPFVTGTREVMDELRRVGDGVHVLPQAEVQTSLRRACDVLGLRRLSHHDFRHMFATRCIQSGVDIPTVARWLGHLDGGALLSRLYFHLVETHSRAMAARVESALPKLEPIRSRKTAVLPAHWQN